MATFHSERGFRTGRTRQGTCNGAVVKITAPRTPVLMAGTGGTCERRGREWRNSAQPHLLVDALNLWDYWVVETGVYPSFERSLLGGWDC